MKPLQDDFLLGQAQSTGLRQAGHAVDWFQSGALADGAMAGADCGVAMRDLGLPGHDGMHCMPGRFGRRSSGVRSTGNGQPHGSFIPAPKKAPARCGDGAGAVGRLDALHRVGEQPAPVLSAMTLRALRR